MYNENLVSVTEKDGKLLISSPYNGEFVAELKKSVPSAQWTGKRWAINISGKAQAENLLSKYYPSSEQLQTVKIEWDLDRDNPQIDGTSLASVSRDVWNWRKDCPIDFKVIEQEVKSGGSRNHPGLFGKLVIEVAIRPDAVISPQPVSIDTVKPGEAPNPLAVFSTEDLLAELARRGL